MVCPPARYCTDNGVMIAWTGLENLELGFTDPYRIDIRSRWPIDELASS